GEVYRATDSKLGREVAIKVLPDAFAKDPERLARFDQEARLLASLNHPHIAAIYGLEESDGVRFLVLELVPGDTLAKRIAQGPIPIDEALTLCRQIAEALEAAHERGIIHRDLKPANVKVTPDGKVKVLDFGLAKAFQTDSSAASDLSQSPTASYRATSDGVILGTAAYMSPEQARGKPVDKRTDIWSFGCVLYECLTGRQVFHGETASDTISAILKEEPDWNALPRTTPASVRRLLRRCLHKEAAKRRRDIGDSGIELDEAIAGTSEYSSSIEDTTVSPRSHWRTRTALWSLAVLLLGGIAAWNLKPVPSPGPRSAVHLTIPLPAGEYLWHPVSGDALAISPDGSSVLYSATSSGGEAQLFLRSLDRLDPEPMNRTEGGFDPFFSPDGEWIGFFTHRGLHKVSLGGGMHVNLYEGAINSRGAIWAANGNIYFVPQPTVGVMQVPAGGGVAKYATLPDQEKDEISHRFPHVLPGGRGLLVTLERTSSRNFDEASIAVIVPETGELKILVEGGMDARYAPTGHLVYARAGSLLAAPFDLEQLELTGQPVPVLDGVITNLVTGNADYDFSRDGTLVYVPGGSVMAERKLIWMDRQGNVKPVTSTRRAFMQPRLSPDGRRLTIIVQAADDKLWIYDLERDTLTRLGFEEGDYYGSVWSPDSQHLVFYVERPGDGTLYRMRADGSGETEPLLSGKNVMFPTSWSPDGQVLAYTEQNPTTGLDIWVLPLEGERKPVSYLRTDFDEYDATFSPDGKWLAYASDETGSGEVYVRPFPGPGGKWQMSAAGGANPVWALNGQELFYHARNAMMVVALETEPRFKAAKPRVLFTRLIDEFAGYAVAPDGQRFLMVDRTKAEARPDRIHIVQNWFEELNRLVPTGNN
ncbi:MAG: protein kinase, partial [Acidobacteriota bacterium]